MLSLHEVRTRRVTASTYNGQLSGLSPETTRSGAGMMTFLGFSAGLAGPVSCVSSDENAAPRKTLFAPSEEIPDSPLPRALCLTTQRPGP